MGIAIIILTIVIRIILWPLQRKTLEAQKSLQELQPKMREIKEKYKDDLEARNREMIRLYKEHKTNPASSCLPTLVQLPILLAVFQVFRAGFDPKSLNDIYTFIPSPGIIDKFFLNLTFFDLSEPNLVLTILTALVQFWQSKMLMVQKPPITNTGSRDEEVQAAMNKTMVYFLPVITFLFGLSLPSGLMLYWLVSTLLMGLQQWWTLTRSKKESAQQSITHL